MDKAVSASEYRKMFADRQKMVTAPSGVKFKIRKLDQGDFMGLMLPMGYLKPEDFPTWDQKTPEERESLMKERIGKTGSRQLGEHIIASGVVEPEIMIGEADDDKLSLAEIDPKDRLFLLDEITKFSGLTKEGREDTRTFPEGERPDAAHDGDGLRGAAPRADAPDGAGI